MIKIKVHQDFAVVSAHLREWQNASLPDFFPEVRQFCITSYYFDCCPLLITENWQKWCSLVLYWTSANSIKLILWKWAQIIFFSLSSFLLKCSCNCLISTQFFQPGVPLIYHTWQLLPLGSFFPMGGALQKLPRAGSRVLHNLIMWDLHDYLVLLWSDHL